MNKIQKVAEIGRGLVIGGALFFGAPGCGPTYTKPEGVSLNQLGQEMGPTTAGPALNKSLEQSVEGECDLVHVDPFYRKNGKEETRLVCDDSIGDNTYITKWALNIDSICKVLLVERGPRGVEILYGNKLKIYSCEGNVFDITLWDKQAANLGRIIQAYMPNNKEKCQDISVNLSQMYTEFGPLQGRDRVAAQKRYAEVFKSQFTGYATKSLSYDDGFKPASYENESNKMICAEIAPGVKQCKPVK